MQMLVPRYLEASIESLTREQEKFRQQISQAFGTGAFGSLGPLEDQVRRNMEMFQRAFTMFTPFAKREAQAETERQARAAAGGSSSNNGTDEIDDLKRQMEEMQKRLDRLGSKDNS
jgi:polyhydroxyalkanoate synthesis regulator protein